MLWTVVLYLLLIVVTPQSVFHHYDADHEEYPYIVSIHGQDPYLQEIPFRVCSGSLLSDSWVLTAAHCLVDYATRIRYGDMTLPRNMSSYSRILKMIPHPGYQVVKISRNSFIHLIQASNNIGLVLVEKVIFKNFGKLSSVDYKSLYGLEVTYVGFGMKPHENPKVKRHLRGEEHLQSSEGAIGPCEGSSKIGQTEGLCVVLKCAVTHNSRYEGDLGGPLLHEGKIVGVCADTTQPRAVGFIPTSPYLEWLYYTMNGTVR